MYALEFKMEEGDLGQYRVICYAGLNERALTKWCKNVEAALDTFAGRMMDIDNIFPALQRINDKIAEMNAAKKAEANKVTK